MATKELTVVNLDLTAKPVLPNDLAALETSMRELVITDENTYAACASIVQVCTERQRTVEDFFEESKQLAHRAHKSITTKIAEMTRPYAAVKAAGVNAMAKYRAKQEQERKQAELAAQRQADEARAKLEAEAKAAKRMGDMQAAREIEQQAELVMTEVAVSEKPVVSGVTERKTTKPIVTDLMLLIRAVADGTIPLTHSITLRGGAQAQASILTVDPAVLAHYAKALGESAEIPGVEMKEEIGFAFGGRK